MYRIMSIATLVVIAICFVVGAGVAFAGELALSGNEDVNDASRPVETSFVENLAQNDRVGDAYDFSDYFDGANTATQTPPVDAEAIEEPHLDRSGKMDC
jgi:hypothetical protein